MTNIWQFLLQTVEVSLTAAILLILKRIFQDKLSPRWQYGIWAIFALRLILPAGIGGRYISMRLTAVMETIKVMTEGDLSSVYAHAYTYLAPGSVLPWITSVPQSITDWLFVIYTAGILVLLARYAAGYICLRLILRKGQPVSAGFSVHLDTLCERYSVRPCRCVVVSGISSAFVCGMIRPVLVIPTENVDEKILLHELLHLKYHDVAQGIFWCLARCLHWCNPLIWYVTGQIACDMESLCDQRVLERLSGEERRDYGRILLAMTNEKYTGAPGTTSLSNGGKNIAKRIRSIAHFKKYPRGMALVFACICILIAGPVFGGVSAMELPQQGPSVRAQKSQWGREFDLAAARVHRCSSQAGAIDTYVKGLIFMDRAYLTAALPMEKQGMELEEYMDTVSGLKGQKTTIDQLRLFPEYEVYNLAGSEKKEQHVQAVFRWIHSSESIWERAVEDCVWSYVIIPIRLDWDGRSWTAEADGKIRYCEYDEGTEWEKRYDMEHQALTQIPWTYTCSGEGESGTVRIDEQLVRRVRQGKEGDAPDQYFDRWGGVESGKSMSWEAYPDTEFFDPVLCRVITFRSSWDTAQIKEARHIGLQVCVLPGTEEEPELDDTLDVLSEGEGAGSDGRSSAAVAADGRWDGYLRSEGFLYLSDPQAQGIEGYGIRIFRDGKPVETIRIKRSGSL